MMKSSAQNTRAGFGDRFIAFANKVSDVSGLVAAYLLVPLVVVFLIEIVSRNVFNHPTTWASGTCFLIGGCAAVLGFGYALKTALSQGAKRGLFSNEAGMGSTCASTRCRRSCRKRRTAF